MAWYGDRFPFTEAGILANARNASGVYAIWGPSTGDDATVYVGEGDDVQRCLLEHRREVGTCIASYAPAVCGVEYLAEAYRVRRRKQLILEFEPLCNEPFRAAPEP